MDSWWDLGEWSGQHGNELSVHTITCPFCLESGNFSTEYHAEKKKPNSRKKLNFDTLKCENCAGYVLVLWSASEAAEYSGGMHNFRILPWPLRIDKYPEHWPEDVGRYWLQAKRNLLDSNWDAANVMARSALQIALRDHNAEGRTLKTEIEDLADKGILPPLMKEWSDEVRDLGNVSAHPKPDQPATQPEDAKDIVRFLEFLLEYLYTLPHRIQEYRNRNQ